MHSSGTSKQVYSPGSCAEFRYLRNKEDRSPHLVGENHESYLVPGRAIFSRQEVCRGERRFCIFPSRRDGVEEVKRTPSDYRMWYFHVERDTPAALFADVDMDSEDFFGNGEGQLELVSGVLEVASQVFASVYGRELLPEGHRLAVLTGHHPYEAEPAPPHAGRGLS